MRSFETIETPDQAEDTVAQDIRNLKLDSTIFHEGGNGKIDLNLSCSSQPDTDWIPFNDFKSEFQRNTPPSHGSGGSESGHSSRPPSRLTCVPEPTASDIGVSLLSEVISGLQLSNSNEDYTCHLNLTSSYGFEGLSSWDDRTVPKDTVDSFIWDGTNELRYEAFSILESVNDSTNHSETTPVFEAGELIPLPGFVAEHDSDPLLFEFNLIKGDQEDEIFHNFSILTPPPFGNMVPHDPSEEFHFIQEESLPAFSPSQAFSGPGYQFVGLSTEESDFDADRQVLFVRNRKSTEENDTDADRQVPFVRNRKSGPERTKKKLHQTQLDKVISRKSLVALLKETIEEVDEEEDPDFRPQHRDPGKIQLQECIRRHTKILLKIGMINEETGEPYEIAFLDPNESERFERDKHGVDGPSVDRFEIDLVSTKSKWNKRLAEVFAEHFILSGLYGYNQVHSGKIEKAFLVHLKTIRLRVIESQGEDIIDKLDKAKSLARDMRRRSLMNRRRKACETYSHDPGMNSLHVLLCSLPHNVCSGDETAHEGGKVRYAITNMKWRSPILHLIFRILDRLHLSTRFTADNRATRGAFPHIRVPSKRKDDRSPPQNLLENFFDPVYLTSLEEHDFSHLKLKPRVTVAFSPQMMRLSERFSRVTNRQTPPLPPGDPSLPLTKGDTILLD